VGGAQSDKVIATGLYGTVIQNSSL